MNAIVGSDVVLVSPIRPTTTAATAVCAAGPSPIEGVTDCVNVDGLPVGLVVVDTPPWDAADETVRQIMGRAARSIVVVTPSRYGDEATSEILAAAQSSDSFCVVANRMPRDMALREQIEDAISERIGVKPAVVIVEGDAVVVTDLVRDVPLDVFTEARWAVLSRAVAGASRRIATGLTEAAREVGSLNRSIDTVELPTLELPLVDASSEWTEIRGLLATAAMSAVSSFDEAVESSRAGGLAGRVRSHLPQTNTDATIESLEEWNDSVRRRFRSETHSRFRKNSAMALLDRWSWLVSVDPTISTPRRFNRLIKHASEEPISACHQELLDILQRPVDARSNDWRTIVDAAGEYRPGVLFAAATAVGSTDLAGE